MSAVTDVARMLALVPWLLERPGASVQEAADAFGVTASKIRKDLGHLDFCGLPGLGGGALFDVTLEEDRVVVSMADELRRPLRLTPREAVRLVMTVATVEDAMGEAVPALQTALAKVRDAAGMDLSPTRVDTGRSNWVKDLHASIAEGQQVRLLYQTRGEEAPRWRQIDPWRLDVTNDGWYVQGLDVAADARRVYRLDRIVAVERTEVARGTDCPDDLATPHYTPTGPTRDVTALLSPSARWIAEAVDVAKRTERDAGLEITFETDTPSWALHLLLMGAGGIITVQPADLASQLRDLAAAALAQYEPRTSSDSHPD